MLFPLLLVCVLVAGQVLAMPANEVDTSRTDRPSSASEDYDYVTEATEATITDNWDEVTVSTVTEDWSSEWTDGVSIEELEAANGTDTWVDEPEASPE